MKFFVCYDHVDYEGCSAPTAIFSAKENADLWVQEKSKTKSYGQTFLYVSLDVDGNMPPKPIDASKL